MEADAVFTEAGGWRGESMEALPDMDAARREYKSVVVGSWGNDPVIWTGKLDRPNKITKDSKIVLQFGNGVLQETPVKITKTLTPEKPMMRTTPIGQVVKRVVPTTRPMLTEQRVIRRAEDGSLQEKIVISPKP